MIRGMQRRVHFATAFGFFLSTLAILIVAVRKTTGCRSYGAWWAEGYVPLYVVVAAVSLTVSAYFLARALSSRHARAWATGVLFLGGPGIWFVFLMDGIYDCPP
jgi:hypothetical protein